MVVVRTNYMWVDLAYDSRQLIVLVEVKLIEVVECLSSKEI